MCSTKADDFVESATMNPAFEESAMFENMVEMMLKKAYDVYVFDTAPTANARRLLGMSKVYSLWVDKMLRSREEARTRREMLSFTKKKEADPLLEYLLGFRQRMGQARGSSPMQARPRSSSSRCQRRSQSRSSRASSGGSKSSASPSAA